MWWRGLWLMLMLVVLALATDISLLSWNIQHGCPCETTGTLLITFPADQLSHCPQGCDDPIHICSCDCETLGSADFNATKTNFVSILKSYAINSASIQEVDAMTIRSGPPPLNESSILCSLFPADGCIGESAFLMTPLITGGYNGIGTYSSVPIPHSYTMLYNTTCDSELTANGHGVLATLLIFEDQQKNTLPVWIFNVHAPGGLDNQTACQAEELIAFVDQVTYRQQELHFIMGDFNADPVVNPLFYAKMSSVYIDAYILKCSLPNDFETFEGHTRPTGNLTSPTHGIRIDYIWIPKAFASKITCIRYDTPNIGLVSDHLPVVLQLQYDDSNEN